MKAALKKYPAIKTAPANVAAFIRIDRVPRGFSFNFGSLSLYQYAQQILQQTPVRQTPPCVFATRIPALAPGNQRPKILVTPSFSRRLIMRKICYGIFFLLLATGMLSFPSSTKAQVSVGISITSPPPPLPVYIQPLCPGPRYIWTPGYWAWGPDGYYWAPGTWVLAPEVGLYWTPGYWGWGDDVYVWHAGFWGPTVGFYGGIDYGFGYTGVGYVGGYWRGGVSFTTGQ
jgi:hypothetical protein